MPARNEGEYASVMRVMTGSMPGSAWTNKAICSGKAIGISAPADIDGALKEQGSSSPRRFEGARLPEQSSSSPRLSEEQSSSSPRRFEVARLPEQGSSSLRRSEGARLLCFEQARLKFSKVL